MVKKIELTQTQINFLKIAGPGQWNVGGHWFNRKDIFSGSLNFMPYTVGLALFKKGLLETDPPGHPPGYDLSFRITEYGKIALEEIGLALDEDIEYKVSGIEQLRRMDQAAAALLSFLKEQDND